MLDDILNELGLGNSTRRTHWRGRAGRLFEQGDLKYVILRLLQEKPRHGYDIIKELESRFEGTYAPSPGVVYPTLTMLEDLGYAVAVPEESGKKIYEITDAGRAFLAEHRSTVDEIFDRISNFVQGLADAPMREVNHAFRRVAKAAYSTAGRHMRDGGTLERVTKILNDAADQLEQITK